jgi:RNA polymerase sigma-70 factor (ECF subfamily)
MRASEQVVADSSLELVQPGVLSAGVAPRAAGEADAITLAAFDRHATSLVRYVRSFGLSEEEAEDVTQEAFLALFQHLSLGRAATNLPGWLFRVAHNLALKRQRTIQRRPVHCSWDEPQARTQVDGSISPEAHLIHDERRRRVGRVVAALPDRDRRCLLLRADGLTYRDIAKAVGVSLGTVAKSLTRTMTRLVAAVEGHADV